ncbi:MAG: hypothetical protein IJ374_08980 [Lachnospiraceae bacterium]|nr:hypothetical protein [Lachnospiraceae bacterium]
MTLEEKKYWIEAYKKYPTGNVSDAMDNLEIRRGVVLGLHALDNHQPKAAGFALTVQQMRRKTAYDGKNLARQGGIIDSETQEGDILVIDMGGIMDVCTGGALLAVRAQMRGVNGELTNGCLRDADEIAELGFPVYCAGTVPVKSARDVETIGVNVPVMMGGVQICPGDLILMDRTGVVCVPQDRLEEVLAEAVKINEREDKMGTLIRAGHSIKEARMIK